VDKVGAAAVATTVAGGLIALQPPVVARVADKTGALPAAAINFVVGAVILVAAVVVVGKTGSSLSQLGDIPWYYLVIGGAVGAVYVVTVVVTVNTLGAAGVVAATIAGQLTASVALDRMGAIGLDVIPLSVERGLGVALLIAGTYLVVR
jgi:bacterial/archaeal transporter family-2 protein